MIIYKDEKYGFFELFNEENGTLIRSDVNGVDPESRSFPELLDVGIMGHCNNHGICARAGIDCYQNGDHIDNPHMSISDFEIIARQTSGKVFQIALGGAGDPNKHPDLEEILEITRYYRIVPNITTSGYKITNYEIDCVKHYCGAVAVSWYSRLVAGKETNEVTIDSVERFVKKECVTNIHYVVSVETLDEAIYRLKNNCFPIGINAVVFILYKPVGSGKAEKVIDANDKRLEEFFSLASEKHPYQIGFDTCFTPAILRWGKNVSSASVDACEAAMFSMYIDSKLRCYPCSFGIWEDVIHESLHDKTIRDIWEGQNFSGFRKRKKEKCVYCKTNFICRTGCRLGIDIDLCGK